MIGSFVGAAGSIIGGVSQAKAASKAAKAASRDRMTSVRLAQEDYRNNMAQRDRDQADLDAIADEMQARYDRARDFDQARQDAYRDRDQAAADALAEAEQRRAIEYARSDEARMVAAHKEAVGYDLQRMVADAEAAGFNPLTVLGATGGAAYAREAAPVVSTPFIGRQSIGSTVVGSQVAERQFAPRPLIDTAGVFGGMSGAVSAARSDRVQSAGYIGDTISTLGGGYTAYTSEQARLAADADLAQAIRTGGSKGKAVGMSAMKPGAIMTARTVDARPVGNVPSTGMVGARLPAEGPASVQDLWMFGNKWLANPNTSNAEDSETRYGDSEVLSTITGLATLGADLYYNAKLASFGRAVSSPVGQSLTEKAWNNWRARPNTAADMMSVGP